MKRIANLITLSVFLLIFITVSWVHAVGPYTSTGSCISTGVGCIATNPVPLISQNSGAVCQVQTTMYYQWTQLASITQAIDEATISVSAPSDQGGIDGITVSLLGTTDDNLPAGGLGATLGTFVLPNPASTPTTLTFNDTSGSALVNYLNAARVGGPQTIALQITSCSASVANLELNSSATLSLLDTNAITLTTFHADGAEAAPNWLLYGSIAAILVLGSLGLAAAYRRRSA